jgi:hypothetical protein
MNGLTAVWKTLAVPALIVSVPASIATIVAFGAFGGADFLDLVLNDPARLQGLPREVIWELARPFYVAAGVAVLLQLLGGVFVALASHSAVAASLAGKPLTAGEATRRALRRYPTGVISAILIVGAVLLLMSLGAFLWLVPALSVGTPNSASVLVALALLAVVLGPGIWVAVSASMTTSAVAIERSGVLASIRRSIQLVRGRWWPTAGFLLMVGLLGGIAIQLIQLVALPLAAMGGAGAGLSIASGLGILCQGLLMAAITAMYTHWYVDLRARKETLSTETLA